MHADPEPRAWAPLANPVFRALAIAQFVSNVGTWMQTVGAQWEMGSLGADPLLIALIVRYRVPDAAQADFRATMRMVGRARRRSGAERWGLFRDGDDPDVFLETFIVPTWEEHLRQHLERPTATDREFMTAARALQDGDGEVEVHHLFSAYGR